MMRLYKQLGTLTVVLALLLSIVSWATYSLWIEYRAYRSYAQTELTALNERVLDAQVRLIEMKSACNALLPVHPDSGNDFSR